MRMLAIVCLAVLVAGCAAMTKPIDVTPDLINALGKDPASACMVNQGSVNAALYGSGNATSTFCRTNAPVGTLSVTRDGVITITHGVQAVPTINLPPMTLTPTVKP